MYVKHCDCGRRRRKGKSGWDDEEEEGEKLVVIADTRECSKHNTSPLLILLIFTFKPAIWIPLMIDRGHQIKYSNQS